MTWHKTQQGTTVLGSRGSRLIEVLSLGALVISLGNARTEATRRLAWRMSKAHGNTISLGVYD